MKSRFSSLFGLLFVCTAIGCLAFSVVGLYWSFMPSVAFGAATCGGACVESSPLVQSECMHESGDPVDPPEDCQANGCLKNMIFRAMCGNTTEGECLFTPPWGGPNENGVPTTPIVTQEEYDTENCAFGTHEWHWNTPGECEWMFTYPPNGEGAPVGEGIGTRCHTASCGGSIVDVQSRYWEARFCSH